MTRKTKSKRINLKAPKAKKLVQVLLPSEDHGKLPEYAARIKAAHPGREINTITDVLVYFRESAEMRLAEIEADA